MLLLMLQLSTAQLLLMLGMNHLYQFGHAPQRIRYLYEQCAGAGAVTKYVSIAGDSRVSTRGRRHCSTTYLSLPPVFVEVVRVVVVTCCVLHVLSSFVVHCSTL